MSDRGFLFLFSVFMIIGSRAAVGYLVATGQALTFDGLFLTLTAAILAAGFASPIPPKMTRSRSSARPMNSIKSPHATT